MTRKACCRPKTFSPPTKNLEIPPTIGGMSPPLLTRPQWKTPEVKKQAVTVSHSKSLYQFVASVEAYPYAKDQYHSSIKSWYVADLILRITFGRPRYA